MFNADLSREVERLRERCDALDAALRTLTSRHDELFDAVAADLGYQAATATYCAWMGDPIVTLESPRRLAKTAPVPEIIRAPTARCKSKGTK